MSYFNLVKMPSPNGTNLEGWYVAKQSNLGPVMAMDAKPKARDADPESVARGLAAMLLGLRDQLGTEAFRAMCDQVCDEEARIADNEARIDSLFDKAFIAQESADAAFENIKKVRQDQLAYLADASLPAPSMTLREARQRHEDAEEALADIRGARKMAEDQRRVLEDRLAVASLRLQENVASVFKSDPGVRRMCERFAALLRKFVDMRRALSFLHSKSALPDECASLLNEHPWPELPGERPFAEAFAALKKFADAELPK